MSDVECSFTREIVCPHCGHEHSDSWEIEASTMECHDCEKEFEIERNHDVTYTTSKIRPVEEKKPYTPPPPDYSFRDGEPEGIARTGTVVLYDSSVNVWDDKAVPEVELVFRGALARLHARGFELIQDPKVLAHYPTMAATHWYGKRGDLEVVLEVGGCHVKVEFFQSLVVENTNGGRYDFNKMKKMPRTMRLQCLVEMASLIRLFMSYGYKLSDKEGLSEPGPLVLRVRDVVDGRWRKTADPLAYFDRQWTSHRSTPRDENGFISKKEYSSWSYKDRDGVPMSPGDTRYFYYFGRLMRGRVYPSFNGQWIAAFGGRCACIAVSEFFSCDPTTVPRRLVPRQKERLRRELEKAIKAESYGRAKAISGVLQGLVAA